MSKKHICPNCGAKIEAYDAKCPYCGYINHDGAEKKYMNELEEVRQKLDVVDDEAREEYKKGVSGSVKIIVIVFAVLIVLTGIITILGSWIDRVESDAGTHTGEDTLAELSWSKEQFAYYDKLYEAGEYDKLLETITGDEKEHDTYKWKHNAFVSYYGMYNSTVRLLEEVEEKGWNEYNSETVTFYCMSYYYDLKEDKKNVDEDEIQKLKPYAEYMHDILNNRLGYEDDELEQLESRLCGEYGMLSYSEVMKVTEENKERYR